jgi:Leucine-rich repeat (LRR) protein
VLGISVFRACSTQSPQQSIQSTEAYWQAPEFMLRIIGNTLEKDPHSIKVSDLSNITIFSINEEMITDNEKKINTSFDFSSIVQMTNLKNLAFRHVKVKDYDFLNSLTKLESISIVGYSLKELPLKSFTSLKSVDLTEGDITQVKDLQLFESGLQYLNISHNKISNLNGIANFKALTFLDVTGNPLTDIQPVSEIQNLTRLQIGKTGIADLSPLKSLSKLQYLDARDTDVTSVSSLANLNELKYLLIDTSKVADLKSLSYKPDLKISNTAILAQ